MMHQLGTLLGSLASSCEGAGKLVIIKHPLAGLILLFLSGFFWAGEALAETPPPGTPYWKNIQDKLKLRFQNTEKSSMKWGVGAGIFSMAAASISLGVFFLASGPLVWASVLGASLGFATAFCWYQSAKQETTSGYCNKLAAGNLFTASALGLAAVFAPPLALLATLTTLASYVSTGFWFMSYPTKIVLDPVEPIIEPLVLKVEDAGNMVIARSEATKQSSMVSPGLLRRCAPRNDAVGATRNDRVI